MKRAYILSGFIYLVGMACGYSQGYETQVISENIHTLQTKVYGNDFGIPVIRLKSDDVIEISFDELSHDSKYYTYQVIHCNADWTASSLLPIEFIEGFATDVIDIGETSINTTVQYTHYMFSLPNDNIRFKISGNYVVKIYEDNNPANVVAMLRFSILEERVRIDGKVRGNTDTDINGKMQQLDFHIYPTNYTIQDASRELKVAVFQNRRLDNAVFDVKPAHISRDRLSYINIRSLIFEGGNEYRGFDFSSFHTYSGHIEQVTYKNPFFNVQLADDRIAPFAPYIFIRDANGRYVINFQRGAHPDIEADYAFVYFTLPTQNPFFDGTVYLTGEFNHNRLDNNVRMVYNAQRKAYEKAILLKQGGYNYQYLVQPKGSIAGTTTRIGGSHWQAENEYAIMVYHRPFGERYDKLIGIKIINSKD